MIVIEIFMINYSFKNLKYLFMSNKAFVYWAYFKIFPHNNTKVQLIQILYIN